MPQQRWFLRLAARFGPQAGEAQVGGMWMQTAPIPEDHGEVLEAVLSLPVKYKDVVYLHYYEGYTASQIGEILGKKANTVYTLLTRARQMLKEKLGEGV